MGRQHVGHDEIAAFAQDKVNLPKDKADEYRAQARRLREKLEGYLSEHLEHRTVRLNRRGFRRGWECDSLPVGGDLRCRSPIRLIFASVW